jgi:hypothetical protein
MALPEVGIRTLSQIASQRTVTLATLPGAPGPTDDAVRAVVRKRFPRRGGMRPEASGAQPAPAAATEAAMQPSPGASGRAGADPAGGSDWP